MSNVNTILVKVDPSALAKRRAEMGGGPKINVLEPRSTVNGQPVIDRTGFIYKMHPDMQPQRQSA